VTTSVTQSDVGHTHELIGGPSGSGIGSTSVATVGTANAATSSGGPLDNRQPYLAINFVIALFGVFPSRN